MSYDKLTILEYLIAQRVLSNIIDNNISELGTDIETLIKTTTFLTEVGLSFKTLLAEYQRGEKTISEVWTEFNILYEVLADELIDDPIYQDYNNKSFDQLFALHREYASEKSLQDIYKILSEPTGVLHKINKIERVVNDLKSNYITDNTLTGYDIKDLVDEYIAQFEKDTLFYKTPFKRLNTLLGGGYTDGLHIIAGRTGHGKTTLALQFAAHFLVSSPNIRIRYYTLEMSPQEIGVRLYQYLFKYLWNDPVDFQGNGFIGAFRQKNSIQRAEFIEKTNRLLSERPDILDRIEIPNSYTFSIDKLLLDAYNRMRKLKKDERIALFIDHLQILQGDNSIKNETERIASITRSLRYFSLEWRIPIFLLSQVNREGSKQKKAPSLYHLKGSSAIEHDAVTAIILYRHEADEASEEIRSKYQEAYIKVEKNRHGVAHGIEIPLLFNGDEILYEQIQTETR